MKQLLSLFFFISVLVNFAQAQTFILKDNGNRKNSVILIKGIPGHENVEIKRGDTIMLGQPFNHLDKFSTIRVIRAAYTRVPASMSFSKYLVTKVSAYNAGLETLYEINGRDGHARCFVTDLKKAIKLGELTSVNSIPLTANKQ